jgi:hypothetical protein
MDHEERPMKALVDFLRTSNRSASRRRSARLAVDPLEGRQLLSVVSNAGGPVLPNVAVQGVYWGPTLAGGTAAVPSWNAAAGSQRVAQLNGYLGYIVDSPYMDMLAEYGVNRGRFAGSDVTSNTWTAGANQVSDAQIENMLSQEIRAGRLQAPSGNQLYVVYLPPGVTSLGDQESFGHHGAFTDPFSGRRAYFAVIPDQSTTPILQGPNGPETPFQQQTDVTSHELAEAATDPDDAPNDAWFVPVTGPVIRVNGVPVNGDEIGDIANVTLPSNQQSGFLNNYLVQKEWVESRGASLLPPDFFLTLNATTGELRVLGGPLGDVITVSVSASNNLIVTDSLAGRSFDTYQLSAPVGGANPPVRSITILSGGGNDVINVAGLPSNTPVRIDAGAGDDSITIASAGHDLNAIRSAVTVDGGAGFNQLTVDDSFSASGHQYLVTNTSVTRDFNTASVYVPYSNIGSITLDGGAAADSIGVWSLAAHSQLQVNAGGGDDNIHVGFGLAGGLDNILSPVTVDGGSGNNTVVFDDSAYAGVASYSIGQPITRTGGNGGTYFYSHVSTATLLGSHGADSYVIWANTVGTQLQVVGGPANDAFRVSPANVSNLDFIPGSVSIDGGGGTSNSLELSDSSNTVSHTYSVTATSVQRQGGVAATYGYTHLAYLELDSSQAADVVQVTGTATGTVLGVYDGPQADLVYVGMTGSLDALGAPVVVNAGGGGDDVVVDDSATAASHNYMVASSGITRSLGTTETVAVSNSSMVELATGGGNDTITTTGYSPLVWYHLGAGTSTVQFQAVPNAGAIVSGGTGSATLSGPTRTNLWQINGVGSGFLDGSISFSGITNLQGGGGIDRFKFRDHNAVIPGTIDGGGGFDTLDYSSWPAPFGVNVNLTTGAAAEVFGGVRNVLNVIGTPNNDILTGNASNNVLAGGAGNDILSGGGGRDILIGGQGADTITGGTDDDIVIGGDLTYAGSTTLSPNDAALAALMSEWGRADADAATRRRHLNGSLAGGLNGAFSIALGASVLDDVAIDTMNSLAGSDWFLGNSVVDHTDRSASDFFN